MLDQHPDTSLPETKELHYFGSVELYRKGPDWYQKFFADVDQDKITGEASTTYFYDRIPYWHNKSSQIEFDDSLPPIPQLVTKTYPEAKYIVILRDPVRRAISAYSHWMKRGDIASPMLGLKRFAKQFPKTRLLEYGYYANYLKVWQQFVKPEQFKIIIFEDDVKRNLDQAIPDLYRFLGLDPSFIPKQAEKAVHKSWGHTRILFSYYASKLYKNAGNTRIASMLDKHDFLSRYQIKKSDIEFLRSIYLPQRDELAAISGRDLSSWDYGEKLLK